MAVLLSLSERDWSPQTINQPVAVDSAAAEIVLSLAHPEWPVGSVARIRINWTGATGYTFTLNGGPRIIDKILGIVMLASLPSTAQYRINKPAGITQLDVLIDVYQAMRSAVLVESFPG